MTTIAMVYFSGYGHTAKLAEAVEAGAAAAANTTVHVLRINDEGELPEGGLDSTNTVAKKGGDGLQNQRPSRDEGDIISQPNSIEPSPVDAKVPHAYNGSGHRASCRTRRGFPQGAQTRHEIRPLYPGLMD